MSLKRLSGDVHGACINGDGICTNLIECKNNGCRKNLKQPLKPDASYKEFMGDYHTGKKRFDKLRKAGAAHPIEKVGAELRLKMKWL